MKSLGQHAEQTLCCVEGLHNFFRDYGESLFGTDSSKCKRSTVQYLGEILSGQPERYLTIFGEAYRAV